MTYTRTKETAVTVTVRETETYSGEDSTDPTPRHPALRVVTTDGETVEESTRPLAKCRQLSVIQLPRKKVAG